MERVDERRFAPRYPYRAHVLLNRHQAIGCDISRTGLAAHVGAPLTVGDTVLVTLSPPAAMEEHIAAHAEVVRVTPAAEGFTVGLQFVSHEGMPAPPAASTAAVDGHAS